MRKSLSSVLLLGLCLSGSSTYAQISAVSSTVSTFVMAAGWIGGSPATQTSFGIVGSVVMDGHGGYFVSSNSTGIIYRVSPDGRVFKFAGGGLVLLGDG